MTNPQNAETKRVSYVVISSGSAPPERRASVIVEAADNCGSAQLLLRGTGTSNPAVLGISQAGNPTSVLKWLGLNSLKRRVDRLLFFPSTRKLYADAVTRELKKRMQEDLRAGHCVTLVTCVPDHALCMSGLRLKRAFPGIRWVMDWQDLWTYDENYFSRLHPIYRSRALRIEREIVETSDCNVTTNYRAARFLQERYNLAPEKVAWVDHHYSRDDIETARAELREARLMGEPDAVKIGFVGTLFKPPRVPGEKLVKALAGASAGNKAIELHVFGDPKVGKGTVSPDGQPSNCFFYPRSDHRQSLLNVAQCDWLLLLLDDLPNCRLVVSQKLPAYLIAGKPILAVVPEKSAIADIVRTTKSGIVVPADSAWEIEIPNALERYASENSGHSPDMAEVSKFERQQVVACWKALVHGPHGTR